VLCVVLSVVCYSVLCVTVVPLPPSINPLAVINNIYIYTYEYIYITFAGDTNTVEAVCSLHINPPDYFLQSAMLQKQRLV
jgi:hypothetical protein